MVKKKAENLVFSAFFIVKIYATKSIQSREIKV